jgi:sterol desaturase/sphingolipid hydroxylase (fatty acid hydroxylase superfamily)
MHNVLLNRAVFAGFGAGVVLWTLLEYLLHRFVFHEALLGSALARDHRRHHGRVDWFAPLHRKLLVAAMVLPAWAALGAAVAASLFGAGLAIGVSAGWLSYELLHRRIHVAAPRNRYGAWARRQHLAHHFNAPQSNHGVTSPLWDLVFGTYHTVTVVRIPRPHVEKFPWLFDEGAVRVTARFAPEYVVRG